MLQDERSQVSHGVKVCRKDQQFFMPNTMAVGQKLFGKNLETDVLCNVKEHVSCCSLRTTKDSTARDVTD